MTPESLGVTALTFVAGVAGVLVLVVCIVVGIRFVIGASPNGGRAKYYPPENRRKRIQAPLREVQAPTGGGRAGAPWREPIVTRPVCIDRKAAAFDQARRIHTLAESERQRPTQQPEQQPWIMVDQDSVFVKREG